MGRLIEQQLSTLFQGVSRQPDTVRLPGQVEEAKNAVLSVVSGGFRKRTGSDHIATISEIANGVDVAVHMYDRDAAEQYVILLKDELVVVYDLAGNNKTVTTLDGVRIIGDGIVGTTTETKVNLFPASGETSIDLVATGWGTGTVLVEASATGAFAGEESTVYTFTGNASATVTLSAYMRLRCTAYSSGTFKVTGAFKDVGYLSVSDVDSFSFVTVADYTFIGNNEVTVTTHDASATTTYGPIKKYDDLPRKGETVPAYLSDYAAGSTWVDSDDGCDTGDIWKIEGEGGDNLGYYFMKLDRTGTNWTYTEAADPNFANTFDPAMMPHRLVRLSNGNFEFGPITWTARGVGDPTVVPDPDFVGQTIRRVTFFRDRLTLLSDEVAYCGQVGDYFNFWPDSAIQVKDSDPFGRVASSNRINILSHAIPFRKVLWCTSEHQQFELSSTSGALTPRTASMDSSTEFDADPLCSPARLGDELYFATADNGEASVYEYFVDDDTISNTAAEITKHVEGYIPTNLLSLTSFPPKGYLIGLSSGARNKLFIYNVYWEADEKAQSAWHHWELGATTTKAYIHGAHVANGSLYLVIRRDTVTYLEKIALDDDDGTTVENFPSRMDRKEFLSGSYDGGNDWTTWTVGYTHSDNLIGLLGASFTNAGRQLSLTYPSTTTVRVAGADHSANDVVFGQPFDMEVTLSKLYVRDERNRAVTRGRTQVHNIVWDYKDTGYFEVKVTPERRDAVTYTFTGRIVGSAGNTIDGQPLESGTFKHRVGTSGSTGIIRVQSSSVVPVTITSATWVGTFNEVSRQEAYV